VFERIEFSMLKARCDENGVSKNGLQGTTLHLDSVPR
jgi:hypothetical protein